MDKYPNEVKMINDAQASMFGVTVDVVEWAEVLIDPKSLIKLRNACRDFWKTNDYDKSYVINVKKSQQYEDVYRVLVAEIGADEGTCYTAAFPVILQVILDKNNEVKNILVADDEHNSFKIFRKDITETIKKHFANHIYLTTDEKTL